MNQRVVLPELLDELDHECPEAVRSRSDILRINQVLGNYRWLESTLAKLDPSNENLSVVELGAGCGDFAHRLMRVRPSCEYTAIDLAPCPNGDWPSDWNWIQGDALKELKKMRGDVLVGNLVFHHFKEDQLKTLGEGLEGFKAVVCNEPARSPVYHVLAKVLHPTINHVTINDLHISIDAGFRDQELPELMGLSESDWEIRTSRSLLGFWRMVAKRTK